MSSEREAVERRLSALEEAIQPFLAFESAARRGLQLDPDHKVTQGSPMAGPQLYARDFLALRAALSDTGPADEWGMVQSENVEWFAIKEDITFGDIDPEAIKATVPVAEFMRLKGLAGEVMGVPGAAADMRSEAAVLAVQYLRDGRASELPDAIRALPLDGGET